MNAITTVPFHHQNLFLVEHNGEPYTPMKSIVEGMGLAWQPQAKKLQANAKRFGTITIKVTDALDGKLREMISMPLRKLPAFMASINPSRVKPELKETIELYQEECDDALWDYWNKGQAINPRLAAQPAELSYDEIMNRALTMSSAKIHALQSANAELESHVEKIQPKADALDRLTSITGSICLTDAAKVLQIKPKELITWLSSNKWIFKRLGTAWLGFQCRLDQGVLEHKVIAIYSGSEKRMREQVRVTPKGLARLAEVFAMGGAA